MSAAEQQGQVLHALDEELALFLEEYPSYAETGVIDDLRAAEYTRLDAKGHIYLDYTGGSLYAESQLRWHTSLLKNRVLGNPHSLNPTSAAMTQMAEEARRRVLVFFNASP
ncbi:MAG: chemotaxis protein CheR, partial [Candidatus Eisenbacteria sp.]|nr:chemotaxis protein CheR [Candidatus Eisenbacteria bacterium]